MNNRIEILRKKIVELLSQYMQREEVKNLPKKESTPTEPAAPKKTSKKPHAKSLNDQIQEYLSNRYEFRFNLLTQETEYRPIHDPKAPFTYLNQRELNTLCIEIRDTGVNCWDRDLIRYINSSYIESYHPFHLYLERLPEWDGTDRLTDLAGRISTDSYWNAYFHRWMLAVTAQWMQVDKTYANSVCPLLISTEQGLHKSTFCKSLIPLPLQSYYTDQMDLSGSGIENKLALMGIINLDEFDRLSPRRMAQLKNLMQMSALNVRRAYQRNFRQLPRIASFIGTSNRKDLLTDPTGSRRFICVEVNHAIDCTHLDHDQIYAQLNNELQHGARYWFTHEEEAVIQEHNKSFYQSTPEEELFRSHFRAAEEGEDSEVLSLVEILDILKSYHPGMLRNLSLNKFGGAIIAAGVKRIHTHLGNRYEVVQLGEPGEP